jgi:hypothetical protein
MIFFQLAFLLINLIPLVSAAADVDSTWKYSAPPSIKTITLGSPACLVFKQMGHPLKKVDIPPSDMGMPVSQNLYYKGVVIGVYPSEQEMEPHVWSVMVTGKDIVIYPGIAVGMTSDELIKLLGKPYSDEERDDARWLFWTAPEPVGIFHVRIRNDRVIEFAMMEDWS